MKKVMVTPCWHVLCQAMTAHFGYTTAGMASDTEKCLQCCSPIKSKGKKTKQGNRLLLCPVIFIVSVFSVFGVVVVCVAFVVPLFLLCFRG